MAISKKKPAAKKAPKKKKKAGRPPQEYLNTNTVQKMLAVFKIDGTIEEACSQAGISPSTHHNRIKEEKNYLEKNDVSGKPEIVSYQMAVEKAQNFAMIVLRKSAYRDAMTDGDKALKILSKRDKRYSDKNQIINDPDNPVQFYIPDNGRVENTGTKEKSSK